VKMEVSFSERETLKGGRRGVISESKMINFIYFDFFLLFYFLFILFSYLKLRTEVCIIPHDIT